MGIALFIDVDNNLTEIPIQAAYARELDCLEEYSELELAFQDNRVTSSEFGMRLVALFREHDFTKSLAHEKFGIVPLQPWADEVLKLPVDIYLISSGPSYYIQRLAEAYAIPLERVLCSQYEFDAGGRLSRCTQPVSASTKAAFVQPLASKYELSIGIGDNALHDGPFISHCDLPILTRPSEHYFQVASFDCVVNFVRGLMPRSAWRPRERPAVFIGSASESTRVAEAVQQGLADLLDCTIWTQGVFQPTHTTIESLELALQRFDFAIFVMAPHDQSIVRDEQSATVRDNVILEVGLFIGRLGRTRCFLLKPRSEPARIPSDLLGVQYLDYESSRIDGNWRAAVGPAVTDIREAVAALGRRAFQM